MQALQQAADQCVKCGVCLPHCPTYALRPEELESPRGRITLLQGLASTQLELTTLAQEHLDNCLSCGRCEDVCPAKVPYTTLIDHSRFHFGTTPNRQLKLRRRMAKLLATPTLLRPLAGIAKFAHHLGLARILPATSSLRRSLSWLPGYVAGKPHHASISRETTTRALLFTGCLSDTFETDIINSAQQLAKALGVELIRSPAGLCCGALSQHLGDMDAVRQRNQHNVDALSDAENLPITTLLSGCGKGLYQTLGFSEDPRAIKLQQRFKDLAELLLIAAASLTPEEVFVAATQPVFIYHPCTTQHPDNIATLTRLVPNCVVTELGKGYGCCGASGDHMQRDALSADKLIAPVCDELVQQSATTVLVGNIGCAWHLRAALKTRGLDIEVLHPLQWLARHLR